MDKFDKFARKFKDEMVFRQMQGLFEDDDVGDGVCASLSYMWVTEQIDRTFRISDWHSVNPAYMFKGVPQTSAIGKMFPDLTVPIFHAKSVRPEARFMQAKFAIGTKLSPAGGFAELGRQEKRDVSILLKLKGNNLGPSDIPEYLNKYHANLHNGYGILGWSKKGRAHAVGIQASAGEFQWYDANFGQFATSSGLKMKEIIIASFEVAKYEYDRLWLYKIGPKAKI